MKHLALSFALLVSVGFASLSQAQPDVTLTATIPSTPFLKKTTVTVSWSLNGGSYDPQNDFVSVWWEPFAATYTEYRNVTSNFGQTTFTLLNARHSYIFRYYRGSTMLAQAEQVVTCEGSYPMQIHTQFVPQHEDRVQVIWTTNRTTGSETVNYGLTPALGQSVLAQSHRTYTQAEMAQKVGIPFTPPMNGAFQDLGCRCLRCQYGTCYNDSTSSLLFVDPGIFHIAEISGLQSGTKYYFQAGEPGGYMSEVKFFKSKIAASPDATVQLLYTADAGVGDAYGPRGGSASHNSIPLKYGDAEGGRHVWDAIKRDPDTANDDSSIMNGDISYARGWPWIWELFGEETEDIFTPAPVVTTYGNHEFDYNNNPFTAAANGGSGGEAGIPAAVRFNFASMTQPWFHMTQGPIHFFALSSEQSVYDQAEWLKTNLQLVNRSATPWLIVLFHRPIYTSSTAVDGDIFDLMTDYYIDLFAEHGVDFVLTGHLHYYERTCPISNGACQANFRPVWKRYTYTEMAPNDCTEETYVSKYGKLRQRPLLECKKKCEQDASCNGAYLDYYDESKCYLVKCAHPLPTAPSTEDRHVFSLRRDQGRPPVYIIDGTAGGAHTPTHSPVSSITESKDFNNWGYSRLKASGSSLSWQHWFVNGTLADKATYFPQNAN